MIIWKTPPFLRRIKRRDTPIIWRVSIFPLMEIGDFSLPILQKKCRRISLRRTSRMGSGPLSMCQATGRWRVTATHSSAMWLLLSRRILPLCPENTTQRVPIEKPSLCHLLGRDNRYSCAWRKPKVHRSFGLMGSRWATTRVDRNQRNMM